MRTDNPYAPPSSDIELSEPRPRPRSSGGDPSLEEARRRLREHLADPSAVAADRELVGPRVRLATWISVGAAVVSMATLVIGASAGLDEVGIAIVSSLAFLATVFGIVLLMHDLSLVRRDEPMRADRAVRGLLQALRFGRFGYAVACLSPSARQAIVEAPDFAPVVTGVGQFTLRSPHDVKAYAATFCRPGHGQIHRMRVKRISPPREEGDVAYVSIELEMQSLPRWAYVVSIVAFVAVRLVGVIVGLVLYYAMRKTRTVTLEKTLLLGADGAYYFLHGGIDTETHAAVR